MRKRFGFEKWPVFCQKKGAVFLLLHEIWGCTKNLNVLNVVQNKFLRWYKNLCLQLWCHITVPKFEHSKRTAPAELGGVAAGRTRRDGGAGRADAARARASSPRGGSWGRGGVRRTSGRRNLARARAGAEPVHRRPARCAEGERPEGVVVGSAPSTRSRCAAKGPGAG